MLKHIVMWKLKDSALGVTKSENALRMKTALEELPGRIPEIKLFEVGIGATASQQAGDSQAAGAQGAWDIVLYSAFEDAAALERYAKHPAHEVVAKFIGEIRSDRAVVDFKV